MSFLSRSCIFFIFSPGVAMTASLDRVSLAEMAWNTLAYPPGYAASGSDGTR